HGQFPPMPRQGRDGRLAPAVGNGEIVGTPLSGVVQACLGFPSWPAAPTASARRLPCSRYSRSRRAARRMVTPAGLSVSPKFASTKAATSCGEAGPSRSLACLTASSLLVPATILSPTITRARSRRLPFALIGERGVAACQAGDVVVRLFQTRPHNRAGHVLQ